MKLAAAVAVASASSGAVSQSHSSSTTQGEYPQTSHSNYPQEDTLPEIVSFSSARSSARRVTPRTPRMVDSGSQVRFQIPKLISLVFFHSIPLFEFKIEFNLHCTLFRPHWESQPKTWTRVARCKRVRLHRNAPTAQASVLVSGLGLGLDLEDQDSVPVAVESMAAMPTAQTCRQREVKRTRNHAGIISNML
jgi:hypothetical protein